jgi:hypothetical protein
MFKACEAVHHGHQRGVIHRILPRSRPRPILKALDESGRRYLNVLQNYGSSMAPLFFYAFDALSLQAWPLHWSVAALATYQPAAASARNFCMQSMPTEMASTNEKLLGCFAKSGWKSP